MKLCVNCRHFVAPAVPNPGSGWCHHPKNRIVAPSPVDGQISVEVVGYITASVERRPGEGCGPDASRFEPFEIATSEVA